MIKITHLFLGFLLVTGPVNAGLITGVGKWLFKLADDAVPHVSDAILLQLKAEKLRKIYQSGCHKPLDSLKKIYQDASLGIAEAQILLGDILPNYKIKCIVRINKDLSHPIDGVSLTSNYWYKKAYPNPVAILRVAPGSRLKSELPGYKGAAAKFEDYRSHYGLTIDPSRIKDARLNRLRKEIEESKY